jgi:hypothetical protein
MRLFIIVFILTLSTSNFSSAQISHTEYEWQVLSWIRNARSELLVEIETHEFYKQTHPSFYNAECECIIDGIGFRNSIDSLINKSKYDFVKHIYTEIKTVVPNKNIYYYDFAPLLNNKFKELEALFLDTKSKQENELGYISKQELRHFSLGRLGNEFRIKVLNLYSSQDNASLPSKFTRSRSAQLINKHMIRNANQKKHGYCGGLPAIRSYYECMPQTKKNHYIKTKKQFRSYMFYWMNHMNSLVKDYIYIIGDSRIKFSNKVNIPLLKQNILNYSQKSSFPFVLAIYQKLHDVLPKQGSIEKIDLLKLWDKAILEIINELHPDKTKLTKVISCKELRKIKDIRHLYDILDIEASDKAKEDYEIESVWIYLIEKSEF